METASLEAQKFVRKPLIVDAVQVTEENFALAQRWCTGTIRNIDASLEEFNPAHDEISPNEQYIHVRVHNPKNPRQTQAHVGDWILYTERGYKVYTDKAFRANFDVLAHGEVPAAEETQQPS